MQGKVHLEELTDELKNIHDLKELQAKKKLLKKKFAQITNLMVAYHLFLEKQPERRGYPSDPLVLSSTALKSELGRLFEIEGALDVFIDVQKDSYTKLTLIEESLSKDHEPY